MSSTQITVEARLPNWLPLPGGQSSVQEGPLVDENDLFPKGEVIFFYPNQGLGRVRTSCGNEIEFHVTDIELVGPKGSPNYISAGTRVGFDYSHTSKGLRITRLKIY